MTDFIFVISTRELTAAALFAVFALLFSIACYVVIGWVSDAIDAYDEKDWYIAPKDRHHDTH